MTIDNRELVARIRGVIRAMRLLTEVGATQGSDSAHVKPVSTPPRGAILRGRRQDLRDLSLADYWQDKFKSAHGNVRQLEVFLFLAERDLAAVLRRPEGKRKGETPPQREERCLVQYAGLTPAEAALAEDCSEGYIRKLRKGAGLDLVSGTLVVEP